MASSIEQQDQTFMRAAIRLAAGNPARPFAAVLVDLDTGAILAEGLNHTHTLDDTHALDDGLEPGHDSRGVARAGRAAAGPIWHGEIDAIDRCAADHPDVDWSKLCLYTTAEPCCMCQGAVLWAGIGRVVFGTSIATLRRLGWMQIAIPADEVVRRTAGARCEVVGQVLEADCDALFLAASRARTGQPRTE